ncbi:MAG: hypothetical protein M0D55_04840 [Elusimicrobiota bacterium]|nr:MAG: hypothetical protein M0D55_04840 [Elusimicrobiota bacterium]
MLPSTSPKRWLGGTLGFENAADIDQNWAGGRPYNGEIAVFDSTAYDCVWNLRDVSLASLQISTAFTRSITVVVPPFQFGNRLSVMGDATIGGGRFQVGTSSVNSQIDFFVNGKLVVKDTSTFVMGGTLGLGGAGAEFRTGALWTSLGSAQVRRASPAVPYTLRVDRATVNIEGLTTFDGLEYLEISSSPFVSVDNLTFSGYESASTNPLVRFISGTTVAYQFDSWSSQPPARAVGVEAFVQLGSTIVFTNSMSPSGNSFGAPKTNAPPQVVSWLPDGGGAPGVINGFLSALPGNVGTYRVLASTSPKGATNTGVGGGVSLSTTMGGVPLFYTLSNVRAPSTYYLFAFVDDGGGEVGAHAPRGGFNHPGEFRSAPVFLPSGANIGGIDVTLKPWGAVQGFVENASSQFGPIVVETWGGGLPNVAGSTRQVRSQPTSGPYLFETPSTFAGVLHSSAVFAFIDANFNKQWDFFEASGTVRPVNVPVAATATVNVTITGGAPAPGGQVSLATAAVHFGAVGAGGTRRSSACA